jgi:hypothetical protein
MIWVSSTLGVALFAAFCALYFASLFRVIHLAMSGQIRTQWRSRPFMRGLAVHAVASVCAISTSVFLWAQSRSCPGCGAVLAFGLFWTVPVLMGLFFWGERNIRKGAGLAV